MRNKCNQHYHACQCREAGFAKIERENAKLREALESLRMEATLFLAATRENCVELNPNNFNAQHLLWKSEERLGRLLAELEKEEK